MEHVFVIDLCSYAPHRTDNFAPPPLPDKYAITISPPRYEENPALDDREPHYHDIISFCLAVDIPDDLGITHGFTNSLIREGHKTTDGSKDHCYIVAPRLVWDLTPGQSTDDLLTDAVNQISALHTVKLSYPDNGERKVRALTNGLFLLPGIVRAFLFYLFLLFAALYIADLYLNAVRLWIPASAHAALSGLSSM